MTHELLYTNFMEIGKYNIACIFTIDQFGVFFKKITRNITKDDTEQNYYHYVQGFT